MIQQRPNSVVAFVCDTPSCHAEIIGPSEADVGSDASMAGWKCLPGGKHVCLDCQRGTNLTADARAEEMYGASEVRVPQAPRDLADGEPVFAPNGLRIGHIQGAATQGEPALVKLVAPKPGEDFERFPESDRSDSEALKIVQAPLVLGPNGLVGLHRGPEAVEASELN